MAATPTKLTALAILTPKQARALILTSAKLHDHCLKDVAADLGCSRATLWRVIQRLDMQAEIRRLKLRSVSF